MTFADVVLDWYDESARDLPWRATEVTPWGVLVSEFMLQQTPAARVVPLWFDWMARWPTASSLAASPSGEAVRAWGRLGYPRRALRLHAAAVAIRDLHGGEVPSSAEALLALPGVGSYTAAAVMAFAFDARVAVLDTNVRRVYARWSDGVAAAKSSSPGVAETAAALEMVPAERPGRFSVAVMELGALICTARDPRCGRCPVSSSCDWLAAGQPGDLAPRRAQSYAGTDRQVRGRLLAIVRDASEPVPQVAMDVAWADATQRERALDSLLDDGLVVVNADGDFHLPGWHPAGGVPR